MRLHGNKVLITGATAGIGESLLKEFLKKDNLVIAVGRNAQKLGSLQQMDQRVIPFACDLGEPSEQERLALFVEQNHQDLNILINNAGIQHNYRFTGERHLVSKIEQEIAVNLLAPIRLIGLLLPLLETNQNSAIVNITSGLGLVPKADAPVYCGTKAGLHIFSKSLRQQMNNTKVFEVLPPLVDTAMTAGRGKGKITADQLTEEFFRAFARDKYEIAIGKVKLLKLINRFSPALADRIISRGS